MYIGSLKQSDEFHSLVLHTIRDFGIKHRHKKNHFSKSIQDTRHTPKGSKVFRRPLCALKTQNVTLKSGTAVEIPSFVVEACCHIKHHCNVEGIFRKAGSAARVREIKAIIDGGKCLESQHHVIDVSNILKLFFRELPEPLLPFSFHDLLLRCLLVKDKATEAILLTCLLFPSVHLNTLVYLMEFFREVADNEESNKMGISNLAIIITPSLMPVEEKIMNNGTRLGHHVRVIEILLHNTERIGFLPEFLIEKALNSGCVVSTCEEMDNSENDENKVKKKKKRRSGSLTSMTTIVPGMINGLKKIVGKGSPEVNVCPVVSTPNFSSPCVKSAKKRKLQESSGAFSSKKKRDILRSLPQSVTLANAPCTPLPATLGELHYTPRVHSHPNPCGKSESPSRKQKHKKFFLLNQQNEKNNILTAAKSGSRLKSRLNVRKSGKKLKKAVNTSSAETDTSCRSEKEHRTSLDWQWKNGQWKRKKCLNLSDTPVYTPDLVADNRSTDSVFCSDSTSCTSVFDEGVDLSSSVSSSESEFVKIPKSEYEEIKNRVSAIENRISQEFGCIASNPINDIGDIPLIDESEDETCSAKKVQSAYEKTLEESEKLGDPISTDQLAKRLSKELKIRHSLENKIIRSPSARKIGTIRRRSRENARSSLDKMNKNNSPKHVVRHASLKQNPSQFSGQDQVFYAKSNLRRGRPNTVFSGLPHPSPLRVPVVNTVETPKMDFVFGQDSMQTDGRNLMVTSGKETSISNMLCNESVKSSHTTFENNPNINMANRCEVRRASSFHGTDLLNSNTCDIKKSVSQEDVACTSSNCGKQLLNSQSNSNNSEWENGPQFFRKHDVQQVPISGRESVVKIRSQNAGMVLARMRLFDKKEDPNRTPSRVTYIPPGGEEKIERMSIAVQQNSAQSLRIKCIQDNFLEKLNSQSVSGERRRSIRLNSAPGQSLALKGSPKKIGSPRKKYHSQKSPKCDNKKQKVKSSKSPQKEKRNPNSGNECNIKKYNSLRENPYRSPLASKINSTAPPSVLNCGKENMSSTKNFVISPLSKVNENYDTKTEIIQQIHLPENLKETIYDVCTPRIEKMSKMSMSPLKDCNRIDVNATTQFESNRQNTYKTPRTSPFIKKPLLMKSPTELIRTPYCRTPAPVSNSHRAATPLKALPNLTTCTPVVSYKQSSCVPREKSRRTVQT